jgi:hypothetical protein
MADMGQGPIILDADYENVLNCYCSPTGEYFLDVSARGEVDTMYRETRRTVRSIVEEFGKYGRIPPEVQRDWDKGNYQAMWTVVPAIQPNFQMVRGQRGPAGMPFVHVVFMPDCSSAGNKNVIMQSGYEDNPISAPRWDVQPGDVYGDGPGILALPGSKSLQVLERRRGQIVDKLASAALQAPAAMRRETISHNPGAVTYYPDNLATGQGRNPITPLYQVDPASLTVIQAEGTEYERRIDEAYFVDLFLATINSDRRQVTAREIAEVHEEKLIALGPVLDRTHYEGLNRDVKRVVNLLARARVLPPPPKELDGMPLKIEYISLLAVAQRSVGATSIERFAGFIGNLAAGNPAVLDKWDMDQTVDEYGEVVGVPAAMVRSDEETAKIRQARQQQEQAMQATALASSGAQAAKVLSEADTGRGSNLLADIIGNQGRVI